MLQRIKDLIAKLRELKPVAGAAIDLARVAAKVSIVKVVNAIAGETLLTVGVFAVEVRGPDGELKWRRLLPNTVVTVGKNYLLDNGMAGSSYTAAFYMGLISNTSFSAINAADTMASHAGWLEAGGTNAPIYSQSARPTCAWSAASAGVKSLSSALAFTIATTGGTLYGAFLTTVATKDGTTGTLFSAAQFTGGTKAVSVGDTVNVSYSLTLS
jgi:hypothetical protein